MRRLLKYLFVVLHLNAIYCAAGDYVSITKDPMAWAENFNKATPAQKQGMYRQSVEDIARTKVGGMWDTVVNAITRNKRLTANELLARLDKNLSAIPDEYRNSISYAVTMKALDTMTEEAEVRDSGKKVETMAKVFSVPLEVAKKLHLKQEIKGNSTLAKYPNVVKAADAFITTEKPIALDMPKRYEPPRSVKAIDTELVPAGQKLSEAGPDPPPTLPVIPESAPQVQNKQDAKPDKAKPVEAKEEPKQDSSKEQIQSIRRVAGEQISHLSSELSSKDALVQELQRKIADLEKQPKEFRPQLIDANRKSPQEGELKAQIQALKDAIAGKDSSMAQLTRERSAEKSDLEAQLQTSTNQLQQTQKHLGEQQTQNQGLQSEMAQKDRDLGARDTTNRQLTSDLQQSRQDLTDTQNQNRNLQDQATQQNRRIQDLQQDVATKSATSNTLGAELNKRDALIGTLKTQNQTLQNEMAQRDRELGAKEADNRQLTSDLQRSQQELADTRTQKDAEIAQLKQEHVAEKAAVEVQLQQSQKELTDTRTQVTQKEAEIARLTQAHATEKSDLEAQLQTADNRLQGLQQELTDIQAQNQDLQSKMAQKNDDLQQSQKALTTVRELIALLDERMNAQTTLIETLNEENSTLKALKEQNRSLQFAVSELSISSYTGLQETVRKFLRNPRYLELLCYKVPQATQIENVSQPVQNVQDLIMSAIGKCEEIYNHGINVQVAKYSQEVNNFNNWIGWDATIGEHLRSTISSREQLKQSVDAMQHIVVHHFEPWEDVKTVLSGMLGPPEHFSESQQQSVQYSLESFMSQVSDFTGLVDAIKTYDNTIQLLTKGIQCGYGVWGPPNETAKELGVAALKTCQLMSFCEVPLRHLNQLIPKHLQGDWNKENVLLALGQIKMKLYTLSMLKLAYDFGSTPISEAQLKLKNMISTLKDLALEDVTLTNTEWYKGCQYFIDSCPAKEKINVSWAQAESIFQKIYKGPVMDEQCFLRMLLSHKLKDLL
jgi:DNA repair exonuclease SbcCD ATPase subunit